MHAALAPFQAIEDRRNCHARLPGFDSDDGPEVPRPFPARPSASGRRRGQVFEPPHRQVKPVIVFLAMRQTTKVRIAAYP
jgi:hypothetical protein